MNLERTLAFPLVAVAFLAVGWLISSRDLWSAAANYTVPWICSAFALAVLILSVLCLATEQSPTELPLRVRIVVWVLTVVLGCAGMWVDWSTYFERTYPDGLFVSGIEWLGFCGIFFVVLFLPLLSRRGSERSERESARE